MDIALELVDTFVADHVYARLLPAHQIFLQPSGDSENSSVQPLAWQYTPATHLFYIQPSAAAYQSAWPRGSIYRQSLTLFLITWTFGLFNYFLFATLSYVFVFDKATFNHPKFLKHQIRLEIKHALTSMPVMAACTTVLFLLEVRGYTKLYDTSAHGPGRWYDWTQPIIFILFTDFTIYWIHRGLHHPLIYKTLHKPHHRWIMPSPFASYAFHPLDGFAQSVPYHVYPMIFPMHKLIFIGAFVFVTLWAILIHDGEYITDNPIINGSACHSAHHLYFNYNFGQFTTIWDRIGGSYRKPDPVWFSNEKMSEETWNKGVKEMQAIQQRVEGRDDRMYNMDKKTI